MSRNFADHSHDGVEGQKPLGGDHSIFRAEALERYAQNQERAVLPRLVSPRSFRILWLAAAFFLVVGLLIAFWPLIAPLISAGAT